MDNFVLQGCNFRVQFFQFQHSMSLFLLPFLAEHKYAASTVLTYISALGLPHRLACLPYPTKVDIIQLVLRGYSKLNPSRDSRLPISLPILENIISSCVRTQSTLYHRNLMQAMYAIAYFAALRIGEITCQPNQSQQNLIFLNQVSFIRNRKGKR